jgi:hypothetical protein
MHSWADDDLDEEHGSPAPAAAECDLTSRSSRSSFQADARHRVAYIKHPSTLARRLYDVEGRLLTDEHGKPVNVWTVELKEMLEKREITCFHAPGRPGYRYFVTYKKQGDYFRKAKRIGRTAFPQPYHVYPDEPGCVLPYEGGLPTAY